MVERWVGDKRGRVPQIVLRLVPLALLLGILLHQSGMAVDVQTHIAPHTDVVAQMMEGHHESCPGHPIHARICPAIPTLLQRAPLTPVLVALFGLFAATVFPRVVRLFVAEWQWPPDRRRALLQVFLC